MHDFYLYEGTDVLKNLLGIKDRKLLEEAELRQGEKLRHLAYQSSAG